MLTGVGEASQSVAVYTRAVVGCIIPRGIRGGTCTSAVAIHAVVDGLWEVWM